MPVEGRPELLDPTTMGETMEKSLPRGPPAPIGATPILELLRPEATDRTVLATLERFRALDGVEMESEA